MELKTAMNTRRSIRSYTGEPISKEQLEAVLTAAYEAPIGMGRYDSIHLTVITNKDLLQEIDENAAKFFGNPSLHPLYGAPMLIVISSTDTGNTGNADAGIILQNMSLEAVEQGVGHCDIYGATAALVQNKELLGRLKLPEGFTPLGSIILGKTNEKYTERQIPQEHRFSADYLD